MTQIDSTILTIALDAWERDPSSYDVTPLHAFSLERPVEASYLWQLARGAAPPQRLIAEALRNLLAWGLISERGALTPLGRRLIEGSRPAPGRARETPCARGERTRARAASSAAGRLSDRALHLIREIAAGRNRIFASDERPPGWVALERLGFATRDTGDRARLTPEGEELACGLEVGQREALEDG